MGAQALLCPVCKNYQKGDPCRYCGSPIPSGSSICYVCKSNQKGWKNWLVYVGGIAAFITLLSSGIVYFSANAVEAMRFLTWKDEVKIGFFNSAGTTLFSNSGDGDIYIADVDVFWGEGTNAHNFPLLVGETIRRGAFLSKVLGGEHPLFSNNDDTVWGDYLATKDGSPNRIMDSMVNNDSPNACFLNVFFDPVHHELLRTRTYYKKVLGLELVIVPGIGKVHYFSVHTGKRISLDFPLLGAVSLRKTDECHKVAKERGLIE
jgi:hypothetical protein